MGSYMSYDKEVRIQAPRKQGYRSKPYSETHMYGNSDIHEVINSGYVDIQSGHKSKRFKSWMQVTNSELAMYSEDKEQLLQSIEIKKLMNIDALQDNHFQLLFNDQKHPVLYVYCPEINSKHSWMNTFETLCPIVLLTKELQCVKNCASNLGYHKEDIENALIKYHQQYGTMYNVNEFVNVILNEREQKSSEMKVKHIESLQCGICHQIYETPATNIHNKTYCYHCIKTWFDIIKDEDQKQIRDPLTNKPLPKHCRLLTPDFGLMAEVWNHKHLKLNEQFSKESIEYLKEITDGLNEKRAQILQYLIDSDIDIANSIIDTVMKSNDFKLSKSDIDNLLHESMKCYEYFQEIKSLILDGTVLYNNQINLILSDNRAQPKDTFTWIEPEWENHIDKNCIKYCEEYQVDELLLSQCEDTTHAIMDGINKLLQNEQELQMISVKELQEKISDVMLTVQNSEENTDEIKEEKVDEMKEQKSDIGHKGQYIRHKKIMYTEKNGLVNTRCIREISDCVRKNKAFKLCHNDLKSKSMTKNQLIRFLETAGMEGIENQFHMYNNFAMTMKHKILKLSQHLKTVDESKFTYTPFWKYVTSVDVVEQPVNTHKDRVELKIRLSSPELDYKTELKDKRKLSKRIQEQLMRHLGLNCDKQHIMIEDIQEGSIIITLVVAGAFVAIIGGGFWFRSGITQAVANFESVVAAAATQAVNAAISMATNMANWIAGGLGVIWKGITGAVSAVISVGRNIFNGLFRRNNNGVPPQQIPNLPLVNVAVVNPVPNMVPPNNNQANRPLVNVAAVNPVPNVVPPNNNNRPNPVMPPQNNEGKVDNEQKVEAPQEQQNNNRNTFDRYAQLRYSQNIGNIQNRIFSRNDQWYALLDCGCEIPFDAINANMNAPLRDYQCGIHNKITCFTEIVQCLCGDAGDQYRAMYTVCVDMRASQDEFTV